MQNLKERVVRSYRLCRFVSIAGSAVAIAAVCAAPSFAAPRYGAISTTASQASSMITSSAVGQTTVASSSMGIDYRALADPDMDHFAIKRAQAYGLTDDQIAEIAKIAHLAWAPMGEVLNKVENGRTITSVAIEYGVNLDELRDCSDWKARISDYMTAYSNTGYGAMRNAPPTVASYSMGTGAAIMPNGTAVAPNGTAVTPNGTTITPNGTTVTPNGTTITPNGTTVTPNGTTITPGGTTVAPDGTTTTPSGTTVAPDGTTTTPSGTTAQ
jgi:hypothetical protein